MSKVTLTDLVNLQNQTTAVNTINTNNLAIETAMDNTLSRDGTSPNTMGANLDMNSYKILNLPAPTSNYEPLRLIDAGTLGHGGTITVQTLPAGGTVNQVLKKNSSTNYDASWSTISTTIPTGGSAGQTLTKNSSSDYDTSWKYTDVTIITPEQFGYTNYGAGDAGPAINAAIASQAGAVTVVLGPHNYNVVTPILITKDYVWLKGSGLETSITFAPTSNNQTLLTYDASPVTTGIYGGRITDIVFASHNTSLVKTAIHLKDVGNMIVSGIYIGFGGVNWLDNTNSSIGLKTNGRGNVTFDNLVIQADKPIVIGNNPNFYTLCADHFHFKDISIVAVSANSCITVDSDVVFSNTTFDGQQAWIAGTYGFYFNGTTSAARSNNLSFSNVRLEQGVSATAYSFYINDASLMPGLVINNCSFDTVRKGFFGRGVSATLSNNYFPVNVEAINVDNTCPQVRVDNCLWEAATTQNIGTLTTKYSYSFTGQGIPNNALYAR